VPQGSVPTAVERYALLVRARNPLYPEAAVWATAWSIYCKHKKPNDPHCRRPPSRYLTGSRKRLRRLLG
jgi:hypothetical protein